MNGIRLHVFRDFTPPRPQQTSPFLLLNYLVINILTAGIWGTVNSLYRQHHIKKLEIKQADLLRNATQLAESWDELAQRLVRLQQEFNLIENHFDNEEIIRLKGKIQEISLEKENINLQEVAEEDKIPQGRFRQVALTIVSFCSHLLTNICTLGFYGVSQRNSLKIKMGNLQAENLFLERKIQDIKEGSYQALQQQINFFNSRLDREHEFGALARGAGAGHLYEVVELRKQAAFLKAQHQQIEERYEALNVQYVVSQKAEGNLDIFREELNDATSVNANIQKQMGAVQAENIRIRNERDEKAGELADIRNGLEIVNQQAIRVQNFEEQIMRLEGADAFLNLQNRLGPIPPKYIPDAAAFERAKEGAVGVDDYSETNKENWSVHAFTYNGLTTASDVFKAGFSAALKHFFEMAEMEPPLFMLNRSMGTPDSAGVQAIYRYIAMSWLMDGKIVADCHGNQLQLNNKGIVMLPSLPEKVLEMKNEGGRQLSCIITHFNQRDDFTPSEEVLSHTSAASGIDPIAAKCILAQLTEEELAHLKNLVLEPLIEDNRPEYQGALEFMRNLPQERAQLIHTACGLIDDMGVALQAKFGSSIAALLWKDYLDVENFDLQPLRKEKAEEWNVPLEVVKADKEEMDQIVDWRLDYDLFKNDQFADLIETSKQTYQSYFEVIKPDLLTTHFNKTLKIDSITWNHMKPQYYLQHAYIREQGCLFSNLLGIFVHDVTKIKASNIRKFKQTMAAYLDDPKHAAKYEEALRIEHGITVDQYKMWLRDQEGAPEIVIKNLTPLQIDIAAHTFGVRIALFTPPSGPQDFAVTSGQVDEFGRLVPSEDIPGHYFGPHTKEVLLMAVENNHTYYGVFPRLNLQLPEAKLFVEDNNQYENLVQLNNYWKSQSIKYPNV